MNAPWPGFTGLGDPGFQLLVEHNADGMLVVDPQGAVLYANPAAADLFGKPRDALLNVPLGRPILAGSITELSIRRPSQGIIDVEMRTAEVIWEGRRAILATLRDVSADRSRQMRLHESQKLEALGRLAAGITHDFNNLLAVIVSGTELLRQLIARDSADPRIDKLLGDMLGRARNGAALTQQLLAFSRRQPLAPQIVDINERIAALGSLFTSALGGGIAVETRLEPRLDPAVVDVNQFEVALLNLAANARDAMSGRGTLTLETCNVPDVGAELEKETGNFIRITVKDTGCGMSSAVLSRVFEPFFSTKGNEGTGLGLSQVYGTVRQCGGHIRIDSEVGRGTSVHLYLAAVRG